MPLNGAHAPSSQANPFFALPTRRAEPRCQYAYRRVPEAAAELATAVGDPEARGIIVGAARGGRSRAVHAGAAEEGGDRGAVAGGNRGRLGERPSGLEGKLGGILGLGSYALRAAVATDCCTEGFAKDCN